MAAVENSARKLSHTSGQIETANPIKENRRGRQSVLKKSSSEDLS